MPTAEPDIWEWRFQLGDKVKTGRTQTRLAALATRRVQPKIDAALRAAKSTASEAHRPAMLRCEPASATVLPR
jgi:hypothetical protein